MKIRRIISFLLVSVFMLCCTTQGIAHSTSQSGILVKATGAGSHKYYGGDNIGWIINEEMHTNGKYIKYKFNSNVPQSVKNKVASAAAYWNNSSPASAEITEDSAGSGTIVMSNTMDDDVAAYTVMAVDEDNGHQFWWMIYINSNSVNGNATPLTVKKLTHEFGHVIGLNDLTSYNNSDKIMYSGSSTATGPADIEARGARLILGRHYSHTWEYVFYQTNNAGNHTHRRRCSYCKGIKYGSIEECTYNAAGVCTKCGTPQGYSPTGAGFPEAILPDPYAEQRRNQSLLL